MTGEQRSGACGDAGAQAPRAPEAATELPPAPPVDSATLLNGRRELAIRHGADIYRLRLTASNKLILTK
jgi:hemin uptake protein HemP